jgi:hypothetical protein
MMNKKGQEEMIGFVLIVVIITVAVLIMLLFSLRKPSGVESSANVENFLQASSYFTTNCEIAGQSLSLKKLIVACQSNERCNDEEACKALNQSFKDLIEANWLEGYNGYELNVYSIGEGDSTTSILQMKKGNLTGSFEGGDVLFPVPPNRFHIYLKVYS